MSIAMQVEANGEKRSTSEILLDLLREHPRDRITIQEVVNALGERGFGFVLLIFSLPAIVPVPPPLGSILGIPLIIFAVQMILKRHTPWLPRTVSDRALLRGDLERIVERSAPIMKRVEKWCRPRLSWLVGGIGERLLGLLVFILALVIALPGPGTNGPPGLTIAFLSIAIIERDGLLVLLGVLGSVVALAVGVAGLVLFFRDMLPWMYDWVWNAFQGLF